MESSTTIESLAADDLFERIELEPDTQLPDGLRRLDERASDVGVLRQALPVRNARLLRVADRGRDTGLRNADHQVGVDRPSPGPACGRCRRASCAPTGLRSCCRAAPGTRTRIRSPSATAGRTGWSARRRRRWPAARRARCRARTRRRRCPARRSPRRPPSRGRGAPVTAAARRRGRGPRRACSRP